MPSAVTTDLRLIYQTTTTTLTAPATMPDNKIKIGLTRGLVDGGEIFAQFSLSSSAHFQHLYTYISAICAREHVLAVYWFSRLDREFVLIHDNGSLDQCLVQAGLHEILYVIAEKTDKLQGYNSKHKPDPIQLKTSSPSSGPSPDTANLDRTSEEENGVVGADHVIAPRARDHIPMRKMKKSPSLEWSYDIEQPPSIQEVSSRDESAFDMTARGERPTYYPYLEHYQPAYNQVPSSRPKPTRTKRTEPKHKYHTHSDESGSLSETEAPAKETEEFLQQPPKRKKKAKRRANRAALEQKRQEIEMESFKEFASTVTADYLAEMCSKASSGRRMIWISIWLASFVYAWYNIALSIGVYLSKPTATKLNFYEASPDGVTFPTVTICNFNKFNKSYFDPAVNKQLTPELNDQLQQFMVETKPIWNHRTELDESDWKRFQLIKKVDYKSMLAKATHTLENTVEFCRFSGKPCLSKDGEISEIPSAAFSKVFTEHGLCYSFNQNGALSMSRTGALYGLSLRLHVAQDDYFKTQDVAGFKVLLHNSYEPPMIEEYGFALRPGSETYVRIRLQKNKDTERPMGYCDPLLEQNYRGGYTISKCVMQNRAVNTIKKCKCMAFYMEVPPGYPDGVQVCNLYQEWACVEPLLEDMALGTLTIDGQLISDPDCPSPCVYTTYSYTISQSEYPSKSVEAEIIREVARGKDMAWDIDRIRDNYLKVHIYFEELSTLEMERFPSYIISNLIGDVGGQLGLLLGMNICSLVQFADYIVRFSFFKGIMGLIRGYRKKKELGK